MIPNLICPLCKAEMHYISNYMVKGDHGLTSIVVVWKCEEPPHTLTILQTYTLDTCRLQKNSSSILESV
jgi:hypothetical protein